MKDGPKPNHFDVLSLHRYFVWADRMRSHWHQVAPGATSGEDVLKRMYVHPYMSYWFGGMYVVVEGWRRLRLADPEIDGLLQSKHVGRLKQHRHGAFHYHPKYFDPKLVAFVYEPDSAQFIHALADAFGKWFTRYLSAHAEQHTTDAET